VYGWLDCNKLINVFDEHAESLFTGHLKMEAVYSDQPDYTVQ